MRSIETLYPNYANTSELASRLPTELNLNIVHAVNLLLINRLFSSHPFNFPSNEARESVYQSVFYNERTTINHQKLRAAIQDAKLMNNQEEVEQLNSAFGLFLLIHAYLNHVDIPVDYQLYFDVITAADNCTLSNRERLTILKIILDYIDSYLERSKRASKATIEQQKLEYCLTQHKTLFLELKYVQMMFQAVSQEFLSANINSPKKSDRAVQKLVQAYNRTLAQKSQELLEYTKELILMFEDINNPSRYTIQLESNNSLNFIFHKLMLQDLEFEILKKRTDTASGYNSEDTLLLEQFRIDHIPKELRRATTPDELLAYYQYQEI